MPPASGRRSGARHRLRAVAALLIVPLALLVASCDSGPGDDDGDDFDRAAMLDRFAGDIILPSYDALQAAVDGLNTAAEAFAAEPTAATLAATRAELKSARLAWQDANLFQFGPAESNTLRAALNTYPADEQQIESNISSGDYTLGTVENRDAAGFPALGYLLYGIGDSDETILAAYTDAGDAANRTTYLLGNVAYVKEAVDATVEAWSSDGGDYVGTFLSSDRAGTDVGSSLGMLINAYVMHYERFIRDGKIGIPAGVRSAGVPRPTSTEAYYGGYSAELATANVRAAQRLFLGNGPDGSAGVGLDDNLRAIDAGALADEIDAAFDEAVAALQSLEDPLSEQIETNNDPVLAAFTQLQDVVILLKADMTSVLGISITYQDNDGD